jgi:hypothetical protein
MTLRPASFFDREWHFCAVLHESHAAHGFKKVKRRTLFGSRENYRHSKK